MTTINRQLFSISKSQSIYCLFFINFFKINDFSIYIKSKRNSYLTKKIVNKVSKQLINR
jgi:hypothetical protein